MTPFIDSGREGGFSKKVARGHVKQRINGPRTSALTLILVDARASVTKGPARWAGSGEDWATTRRWSRRLFLWDPSAKRCPTRTSPRRRQAPRSPETTFKNVPGPRRCQRAKCCRCSQGDALYATKRPGNNSAGARQPRHRAYKCCFKCPWTTIRAAWPGIEHELARRVEAGHGLEPPR